MDYEDNNFNVKLQAWPDKYYFVNQNQDVIFETACYRALLEVDCVDLMNKIIEK